MRYIVERKLFDQYPNFVRGVVVATGIGQNKSKSDLIDGLNLEIERINADLAVDETHPRISEWQKIYKSFLGNVSRKARPSVGALVERIRSGKASQIPFVSPLVAISNTISLRHLVPSGPVDISRVAGNLRLGFASGGEDFTPISGDHKKAIEEGEVVYFDDATGAVLCRAWNSRGGRAGMIGADTNAAVIDVDGLLNVISLEELTEAISEISSLLKEHCNASTTLHLLSPDTPEFEIPL